MRHIVAPSTIGAAALAAYTALAATASHGAAEQPATSPVPAPPASSSPSSSPPPSPDAGVGGGVGGFTVPAGCSISFGSAGPEPAPKLLAPGAAAAPAPAATIEAPSLPSTGESAGETATRQSATGRSRETGGPRSGPRIRLSNYVDIQCRGFRIQADTVVYDTVTKQGLAEGVVVLDWERNRITGSRLEFDLVRQTGTMSEASGWIEPEAILEAKTIQKLDEDHVLLENGTFTSCTQPIPYWSFRIGRGLFHLNHYAYLRHVRMNIGRVPVFYLPWMLWPIKGDRAAGFLFPQWGTSRKYGFFVGDAFFWPFARNADVTLYADYYRLGGIGGGVEANWLPAERGRTRLTGYGLWDTRRDERRHMARLQVQQPFAPGWRMAADLNDISDFRYYQDFERDLSDASSTVVLSTVHVTHNGEVTSLNVRAQRREQFFLIETSAEDAAEDAGSTAILRSDLKQDVFPEIELRGRSRSLPGTPLYFSFESSANYFRCDDQTFVAGTLPFCTDATWARLDLAPRLTAPLRLAPWLSIEGRGLLRETYYTAARDPVTGAIDDTARVDRNFYELEGELVGPRFYRVYASRSSFSSSYKHVVEPRMLYRYVPRIDTQDRVPIIDDRDPAVGNLNLVNLGIRSSLYAKRPSRIGAPEDTRRPEGSQTGGSLPWSSFPVPVEAPLPEEPAPISSEEPPPPLATSAMSPPTASPETPPVATPEPQPPGPGPDTGALAPPQTNPVEILNVEIAQSYSFENPLSTRFGRQARCLDGTLPPCAGGVDTQTVLRAEGTRAYGPLSVSLHFNPRVTLSVDLRSDYDLVNRTFTSSSFSGWYRWKTGYLNTTYSRQNPPGTLGVPSSQIRIGSGALLFNRKLTLDADLGYDLQQATALDRRARVGYYTQCCGFVVEYLQRDFEANRRREVRFVVDLKGIGKFLDPNVSLTR